MSERVDYAKAAESLLKAATAAREQAAHYDAVGEQCSDEGDESKAYRMAGLSSDKRDVAHFYVRQSQTHAMLAIAEQLRVANLIALTNVGDTDLSFPAFGALVDDWKVSRPNHSVNADIAAILGLDDDHE